MKEFYIQYYIDNLTTCECAFIFGIYSYDKTTDEVEVEFKLSSRKLKKYCNEFELCYKAVKNYMDCLPSNYKYAKKYEHDLSFQSYIDQHVNNFRFIKM